MVSGISGFPFIFYLSFALLLLVTAIGKVLKLRKEKIILFTVTFIVNAIVILLWNFIQELSAQVGGIKTLLRNCINPQVERWSESIESEGCRP